MFIEFHSNEDAQVIKSCAQCSGDVPIDADVAADMEEDYLFCDGCVVRADPFLEYGSAVAWADSGEYVHEVHAIAKGYEKYLSEYQARLWLAGHDVDSEQAYGHTSNQQLNGLVSICAVFWNDRTTEHIALSTN